MSSIGVFVRARSEEEKGVWSRSIRPRNRTRIEGSRTCAPLDFRPESSKPMNDSSTITLVKIAATILVVCSTLVASELARLDLYLPASRAVSQWPRDSPVSLAAPTKSTRWRRHEGQVDARASNDRAIKVASFEPSKTAPKARQTVGRARPGLAGPRNVQQQNVARGRSRNQVARSAPELLPKAQALQAGGGLKCALILQRTYVSKSTELNDYESSGNENHNSEQEWAQPTGKKERVCITYDDVNRAIVEAKRNRNFSTPPMTEIESIEPSLPVVAQLGELNQEVTKLLAQKFDLSADEILNGLPLIDMSRTEFWSICPLMVRPIRCDPSGRFRAFTGHCNNLMNPTWGAAQTPFVRYAAPQHPDGIQAERASALDGSPLPSPRLVTSMIHRDHDQPSSDLSLLIMVWGQVIDHDVALAAPPRGKYSAATLIWRTVNIWSANDPRQLLFTPVRASTLLDRCAGSSQQNHLICLCD